MAKPYDFVNEIQSTLSAQFVHGTDTSLTLTSVANVPTGGNYIRIGTHGADHWALYEYTGVSTNDLTGLTPCTLGKVESEAAYTFPIGTAVEIVNAAEIVKDVRDEAIHKAITGEILAIAEKTTPVVADLLLIEDSAASNVKKRVQIGNLPGVTLAAKTDPIIDIGNINASPFDADIAGNPTATNVVYDGDTGEDSIWPNADRLGTIILHNTTRGNSRRIVSIDTGTNTITTESSTDDWADNDVITTQSQTCASAGFIDLDISDCVGATTTGIILLAFWFDSTAIEGELRFHTFEAYSAIKTIPVWNKTTTIYDTIMLIMPVLSQKICMKVNPNGATGGITLRYFGEWVS